MCIRDSRTTNFIKNNGIQFDGNKVYLVIDGIVVKAFQISKDEDGRINKLNLNLASSEQIQFKLFKKSQEYS